MKYFEVKYFQPATRNRPSQYCYISCYQRSLLSENPDAIWLTMIGSEGIFPFVNGVCEKFLGYYRAEIVGEILSDRAMEADRLEEVAPSQLPCIQWVKIGGEIATEGDDFIDSCQSWVDDEIE